MFCVRSFLKQSSSPATSLELFPATFSSAQGPEGAQHLAAELSKLTDLQSLQLVLLNNKLGPGPQASRRGGARRCWRPFPFCGGFSEQQIQNSRGCQLIGAASDLQAGRPAEGS